MIFSNYFCNSHPLYGFMLVCISNKKILSEKSFFLFFQVLWLLERASRLTITFTSGSEKSCPYPCSMNEEKVLYRATILKTCQIFSSFLFHFYQSVKRRDKKMCLETEIKFFHLKNAKRNKLCMYCV